MLRSLGDPHSSRDTMYIPRNAIVLLDVHASNAILTFESLFINSSLNATLSSFGHGTTIWNVAIRISMSKQSNELRVLSEGETEISSDDNSKHLLTEFC